MPTDANKMVRKFITPFLEKGSMLIQTHTHYGTTFLNQLLSKHVVITNACI